MSNPQTFINPVTWDNKISNPQTFINPVTWDNMKSNPEFQKGHETLDNKKSNPKFNKGDYIMWDSILWLVKDATSDIYELQLVNSKEFTTKHGNGGYLSSQEIDKSAEKVDIAKKGGWKRSRKNRTSKNRRRNSAKRQ